MIISIIATTQKNDAAGNLSAEKRAIEQVVTKIITLEKKPVIHVLKRYGPQANENQVPKKVVNAIFC